jgi:deoxyadenosine/deoxycytidine kinase
LSEHFDVQAFHEPNLENPFLQRFYHDMSQWAFHSQVFFLVHKFNAHRALLELNESMIQDRTIYEDAEVFATHLHESGLMSAEEFKTYQDLYLEFIQLLPAPTLMIYLRASVDTIVDRIEKRGRPEEREIPRVYLEKLHELYETWFSKYDRSPKLVIQVDGLDFVHSDQDQEEVINLIKEQLESEI